MDLKLTLKNAFKKVKDKLVGLWNVVVVFFKTVVANIRIFYYLNKNK